MVRLVLRKWLPFAIPVVLLFGFFLLTALIVDDQILKGLSLGLAASVVSFFVIAVLESIYRVDVFRFSLMQEQADEITRLLGQGLSKSFTTRAEVNWGQHAARVKRRFWTCGTTLRPLAENPATIKSIVKKGAEVRVLLPSTEPETFSREQLRELTDLLPENQIEAANGCGLELARALDPASERSAIREYPGIMYCNIGIFDEIALIAFYNSSGVGDSNWSLQFEGRRSPGYRYVEEEFERMWEKSNAFRRDSSEPLPPSVE